MMRRPAYDPEEIRDALTVADVLEFAGILVDGDRIACPIHGGEDVTAFAIYDQGRRYWCYTECGKGGDVFTLITALAEKRSQKVGFRRALEIAACLAEIEPGPPPSPAAIAARKAERERRKAERAASLALKHDESIRRATEVSVRPRPDRRFWPRLSGGPTRGRPARPQGCAVAAAVVAAARCADQRDGKNDGRS